MFDLHTDHHIAIGRTHLSDGKPCQDHAMSGVVKEYGVPAYAYAVVADGCSSAGETDIGARLMTTLTAKTLNNNPEAVNLITHVVDTEAYDAAVTLGLDYTDLYATHLYAIVDVEGNGYFNVRGDGVVALLYESGAVAVYKFEWANNMPFYPLYSSEGLRNFYIFHGGSEAKALTVSTSIISPNGIVTDADPVSHTVAQGAAGITISINNADNLSMIVLFTDGICQIDKVDWLEAVSKATSFKNMAGSFVKRRMINFLKETLKSGRGPLDDVSIAVIALTPSEIDKDPAYMPPLAEKSAELPVVPLNAGVE